jgi:predicted ATP-binding protein involved in virulence
MRLQRVQIPNFRVLKDIDITFEPHRVPQIFPLASQNGGGKSTLLQLIFTLLTCNDDSDRTRLVKNLLLNAGRNNFINGSELLTIELVDN